MKKNSLVQTVVDCSFSGGESDVAGSSIGVLNVVIGFRSTGERKSKLESYSPNTYQASRLGLWQTPMALPLPQHIVEAILNWENYCTVLISPANTVAGSAAFWWLTASM